MVLQPQEGVSNTKSGFTFYFYIFTLEIAMIKELSHSLGMGAIALFRGEFQSTLLYQFSEESMITGSTNDAISADMTGAGFFS